MSKESAAKAWATIRKNGNDKNWCMAAVTPAALAKRRHTIQMNMPFKYVIRGRMYQFASDYAVTHDMTRASVMRLIHGTDPRCYLLIPPVDNQQLYYPDGVPL